jgi:hypothetical protein
LADHQRAKISVSEVDNISRRLDTVEAPSDASVSKQKAIAILAPKLHAMRSKGYSWSAIATWLKDNGLDVTAVALQGYLRRVRLAEKSKRPPAIRKGRDRNPTDGATSTPTVTRAPVATAPTTRLAPAEPLAAKPPGQRAAQPSPTRYGTFVPREDTKDI